MATRTIQLDPRSHVPPAANYPTLDVIQGTNFPVWVLDFDASTDETTYFGFVIPDYGSGNLTLTVLWEADTASSGDVVWGAAIACVTPNTDSQDIETKSFATAQTATDSHLGTTGQRLHSVDITISNLDSLASGDHVWLKFYRDVDPSDSMTGDASLVRLLLSYSDT